MTEHHVIHLGDVITDRWGNVGIVLEVQPLAVRIPHAERIDDSRWVKLWDIVLVEPPVGR